MTQPTKYVQKHNYSDELGTTHGVHLNEDYQALKATTDQIIANLGLIQRDDGALFNEVVTPDSLSPVTLQLVAGAWKPRGQWVTGTLYSFGDFMTDSGTSNNYVCISTHTSSAALATDISANRWMIIFKSASASAATTAFTPSGSISSTNVQSAIAEVSGDIDGHIADTTSAHAASSIGFTPVGNVASTDVQAAIAELDTEKVAASGGNLSGALNENIATLASATTLNLFGSGAQTTQVTGGVTITGFTAAPQAGARRKIYVPAGATWILVNSASLMLDGGNNYTAVAGDVLDVIAITTSTFKITSAFSYASNSNNIIAIPTPTLSANAMTIPAATYSMDVRSATLGSGTITHINGTDSALTIPAGATLGSISGQLSNIIVVEMNVSGTWEKAVINIAGGNDLSETGLISTTAISSSSNSNGVFYSNTARSNVPYRVVGRIESTQATAGQWVTFPSLVQGAGGNALTSMSSIGYGQTWQNVTASRALNITYYNTRQKPISFAVQCSLLANGVFTLNSGGLSISAQNTTGSTSAFSLGPVIVPPGSSYQATNTLNATLTVFNELL